MKTLSAMLVLGLSSLFVLTLAGCPKKGGEGSAEGGVAAASASAATTTADTGSATTSDTPPAAVAMAPAANVPGVVSEPNARPTHDGEDNAAKAEISKANYKKEIDRLEKEDLAQDKK